MKKFVTLVVSLILMLTMSIPAFAMDDSDLSLEQLAERTIRVSQTVQETGVVVTTFEKLNEFIREVRNYYPNLSDYDLAKFILDYTGQDSSQVPEVEALMMLEYDNISIATSYAKFTEEAGFVEISEQEAMIELADRWDSPDGYMRLNTNFSKISTSGNTKQFNVWTTASWLKSPAVCLEDALMVGTNGSFDDSYSEFAYVHQTFKCRFCGKSSIYNRYVDQKRPIHEDVELKYTGNGVPAITFAPLSPRCDYCDGGARDDFFSAFIRYGVLIEGSGIIQASYGHKTFGLSGISVGVDATGMPSFSVGIGATLTTYNARPVTLQ